MGGPKHVSARRTTRRSRSQGQKTGGVSCGAVTLAQASDGNTQTNRGDRCSNRTNRQTPGPSRAPSTTDLGPATRERDRNPRHRAAGGIMTASGHSDIERRVVGKLLRDWRAADVLGPLVAPAAEPTVVFDCSALEQIDAYGAAVIRTSLDAHVSRDPRHMASIVEPRASDVWPFLSDAIGPPPSGSKWAGTRSPASRGTDVLIPAMSVRPNEAQLIVRTVGIVAAALGHGPRPGQLLREAAQVFLDNAAEHAAGAPTSPVVCAAFEPMTRNLQLVCVNLVPPGAALPATEQDVERMVADSDQSFRSIASLTRRRSPDLDFSVRVMAGACRARHRTGRGWRYSTSRRVTPGFIAGIEVHR